MTAIVSRSVDVRGGAELVEGRGDAEEDVPLRTRRDLVTLVEPAGSPELEDLVVVAEVLLPLGLDVRQARPSCRVEVVRVETQDLGLEAVDAVLVVGEVVAVDRRGHGAAVGARLPGRDVLPVGEPQQLVAAALDLLLRGHGRAPVALAGVDRRSAAQRGGADDDRAQDEDPDDREDPEPQAQVVEGTAARAVHRCRSVHVVLPVLEMARPVLCLAVPIDRVQSLSIANLDERGPLLLAGPAGGRA
jgi:hypothetical protein